MNFYAFIFENSKVLSVTRYGEAAGAKRDGHVRNLPLMAETIPRQTNSKKERGHFIKRSMAGTFHTKTLHHDLAAEKNLAQKNPQNPLDCPPAFSWKALTLIDPPV